MMSFKKEYFQEILNYLSISEEKFWEIVDSFRNPLFWKTNKNNQWEKINTISNNL